jgi:hypothetical protein
VWVAACAVLFFIPVVRARRWRKAPPAPRTSEIEMEASYPQILSRVSDAIEELDARVTGLDLDCGRIELRTPRLFGGWGERVSIRIDESRPGFHSIVLESASIHPTGGFGGGKNDENLNKIVEILLR